MWLGFIKMMTKKAKQRLFIGYLNLMMPGPLQLLLHKNNLNQRSNCLFNPFKINPALCVNVANSKIFFKEIVFSANRKILINK